MQPDIPALLAEYQLVATALAVVMILAVHYQRGLAWHEYRVIHRAKVLLFPALDSRVDVLVNPKGRPGDDAEYLRTVDGSVREVFGTLRAGGGSPHLINSIKRRPGPDGEGVEYSAAHLVWTHDDETQTEAYLFRASDGNGVDVYSHAETAVTDPEGHLSDPQTDGDPRGVVTAALAHNR